MSYLLKLAEAARQDNKKSKPEPRLPHQEKAVQKALANDGSLLLSHPMGSGKTRTSIEIVEELKKAKKATRALVVVPSSLRTNYLDNGVKRWSKSKGVILGSLNEDYPDIYNRKIPDADYYVVSYDMFRKDPDRYVSRLKPDTLVVDEVHNFRNEGTKNLLAMQATRKKVRNFIGMTGTMFNNDPSDVFPLVDLVAGGAHNLGRSKDDFKHKFIGGVDHKARTKQDPSKMTLKNQGLLGHELRKWVHYADENDVQAGDIPQKVVEDVAVEMSPEQKEHYDFVMKRVPEYVRQRIRKGMPATRKEAFAILPMLQQARAVSNSVGYMNQKYTPAQAADATPKTKQALDDVAAHLGEHPKNQALMHSHLVNGGTDVLSAGLTLRGIPHGVISGETPHADRDKYVKAYNAGKLRALVLSSAGTTGLNLPNTTFHAALDGHYNPAVIDQIEARGVRAGGQAYRPKQDRKVIVKRYRTAYPQTLLQRFGLGRRDTSVDEWIYNLANDKKGANAQAEALLKKTAALKLSPMQLLDLADEAFDSTMLYMQVKKQKERDAKATVKTPREGIKTASLGSLLFAISAAKCGPEWLGGPAPSDTSSSIMRVPTALLRIAALNAILSQQQRQMQQPAPPMLVRQRLRGM